MYLWYQYIHSIHADGARDFLLIFWDYKTLNLGDNKWKIFYMVQDSNTEKYRRLYVTLIYILMLVITRGSIFLPGTDDPLTVNFFVFFYGFKLKNDMRTEINFY